MLLFCLPDTPIGVSLMFEHILSLLQNTRQNSHSWTAQCPAHQDKRNSLSLAISQNNTILIKCFAGCSTESITHALGISLKDLFPDNDPGASSQHNHDKIKPSIDRTYDYTDEFGNLIYQNVRFIPKDFRLRKPAPNNKWSWNLNGTRRTIYKLPEILESIALERTIIIVESEKSVDRLISLGFSATTSGGASSWKPEFSNFFTGANVVIIPDRDKAGDSYALTVASSLHGKANQVSILTLPLPWSEKNGLDVFDWLLNHSAQDLLNLIETQQKQPVSSVWDTNQLPSNPPQIQHPTQKQKPVLFGKGDELLSKQLGPIRWAVPGLITEGLWLLCGKPKMGKSWLALSLSVAQATGGSALGKIKIDRPGDVLYLPLEDNERRFKSRLEKLLSSEPLGKSPSLHRLSYLMECPRLDQGGLDLLEQWLIDHPNAISVVIDTHAKIKPLSRGRAGSLYDEDYRAVQGLKALADRYQVLIILIHHLRKASADDVQDTINATTGLAGGVDGTMILQRARGKASAVLHIDGRDIPEVKELSINWDNLTAQWTLMGDAEEFRLSEAQAAIIAAIKRAGQPLGPKALLDLLKENEPTLTLNAVSMRLHKMTKAGNLQIVGRGNYSIPG